MTLARRATALLLTLLAVLTLTLGTITGSPAGAAIEVDGRLSQAACDLTGRIWVTGGGCARHRCVAGATIFKEGYDAELCRKAGRGGAEYARPISSRRCAELHRVWIGEINSCASNPERRRFVVPHSPACTGRATTYVNHREQEGYYDECLTPREAERLERIAGGRRASLNEVALDRSRPNCAYRGGWTMSRGACVRRVGPPPSTALGGLEMIGDSVSWRAENEIGARRPDWGLDLRPGRRLDELGGRLDWFAADHGDPDNLVIQLGTNRRPGFNQSDFEAVLAGVPATTPVLFLLPFRDRNSDNEGPVRATRRYAGWMRDLAAGRPLTCLADWPSYAAKHLDRLVDGEHPASDSEDWYARYVIGSWQSCQRQLP